MSEKFKSILLAGIIAILIIAVGLNIGQTVETQQRIQMRQDNLTSVNEQLTTLYANLQDIENTCSSNRIILGNVIKTDDTSGQTVVSDIDSLLLRVSETEADILNFQDFLTSGNAIDQTTLEDINNTYDEIGQSMVDIQNLYNNTSEELSSYIDSYMVTSDNTSDDTIDKLNDIKKNMNGLTVNTATEFAKITKEEKTVFDTFTDSLNETLDSALSVINKNSTQTKTNLTNGYNQTQTNINDNYNNTNDYLNTNNNVNLYSNLDNSVTTFDETFNSITFNYGDDYNTNESNLIADLDLAGLETSFIDTKSLADLSIEQEFAYFDACYDAYVDKIQLMMEYNKAGLAANIDALYQVHTGSNYSANDDDAAFVLYSAAISAIPSGASITSVQYLRHYHIDANGKVDGFTDPDHAPQTIISDTVVGGCYIDKGRIESDITTSTSSNPQPVDGGGGYTYTPDVWGSYSIQVSCNGPYSMRGYRAAAYAADGKTATRFCCDGFTCNTCGKNTGSYQEWDSNGPAPTENSPHGRTTTVTGRIPTKLSPAHTYTCPCTNGQLIGIVINYTVGDTAGSVTLTTP